MTPMRSRNDNGPERWVKIEQLEGGGRREYIYRDRAGVPADEDEATHVEVIDYDAEGCFVFSTIAERNPLSERGGDIT
jgi:hypothetical protein